MNHSVFFRPTLLVGAPVAALATMIVLLTASSGWAQDLPNACPVDGCTVTIIDVAKDSEELLLTFDANFAPSVAKNHIHVWWGDLYTVEQVSNNAETVHGVVQGDWHPTEAYPVYVTQSGASTSLREGSTALCVSAADRNHDILDVSAFHCVDVSGHF
ncbi:MAG: hypothetical protein ACTS3R_04610 [Inquilinaceae bacterium]